MTLMCGEGLPYGTYFSYLITSYFEGAFRTIEVANNTQYVCIHVLTLSISSCYATFNEPLIKQTMWKITQKIKNKRFVQYRIEQTILTIRICVFSSEQHELYTNDGLLNASIENHIRLTKCTMYIGKNDIW